MADRMTKSMVIKKFQEFCSLLGCPAFLDEEWDRERRGLFLDMSYRGKYFVRRYTGNGTILTPFGLKSRNAAEMWDALDFACDAIRIADSLLPSALGWK